MAYAIRRLPRSSLSPPPVTCPKTPSAASRTLATTFGSARFSRPSSSTQRQIVSVGWTTSMYRQPICPYRDCSR